MSFNLTRIVSGGLKLLTYGPMEGVAATAATPVFVNLKTSHSENSKALKDSLTGEKKNWFQTLKESFSYGDIGSIVGLVGYALLGKFIPAVQEGQSPGFISNALSLVRKGFMALIPLGVVTARIGQHQKLHIKRALGEKEFRKIYMEAIEGKTGKKIFMEEDNDTLVARASKSTLEYNQDQQSQVKDLHHSDNFKRFFTGEPGTGKTSGVMEICGSYIARKRAEGHDNVVVKTFNFANLNEFFSLQTNDMNFLGTLAGMAGDEIRSAVDSNKDLVQVDPFALMELVLQRIQDEMAEAKEKGKDLILILDEFDSIFQVDKMKAGGFDPAKLRVVFEMIKNLADPDKQGKILFTSNKGKDFFGEIPHIDAAVKDSLTGQGGRLTAIQRVIRQPNAETQSRIIAAYLLTKYPDVENTFSQEILTVLNEKTSFKEKKVALAKLIYEKITSGNDFAGLVGRDLNEAINKELVNCFAGEKTRADDSASVRITLDMIRTQLKGQLENSKSGSSSAVSNSANILKGIINNLVDIKNPSFRAIANNYIQNSEALQNAPFERVLGSLFNGVYELHSTDQGNFLMYPVDQPLSSIPTVESVKYLTYFRVVKPKENPEDLSKWTIETFVRPISQVEAQGNMTTHQLLSRSANDFDSLGRQSAKDFYSTFTQKLISTVESLQASQESGQPQQAGGLDLMSLVKSAAGMAGKLGFKIPGLS